MSVSVAILAHNEESRIGRCIASLLAQPGEFPIHVVVNGTTDNTASIARNFGSRVIVHEFQQGGKSRSWNRFVFDVLDAYTDTHIFVDGDAEIAAGSVALLQQSLAKNPSANAASGVPLNGRNVTFYQLAMQKEHGLFGDLYALRGDFLARMKAARIQLPQDLIGDDGLIGSLAKTDLKPETNWQDGRVVVCANAGFHCEPTLLRRPATWKVQYARKISYSMRHFQNQIVTDIMRSAGPAALPTELATFYARYLSKFRPRWNPTLFWFDRRALQRMQAASQALLL